jgi:outer membrane autotransporter protein
LIKDTTNWGISSLNIGVAEGSTLTSGATYEDVIKADATSSFDSTVSKTGNYVTANGTYTLNLIWDGTSWDLKAQRLSLFSQSATNLLNTPAGPAATVLDAELAIGAKFAGLSTEKQFSDAASQTLPLLTGGTMTVASAAVGEIGRVVQLRSASATGLASGNGYVTDGNIWFKPFGSWAKQADRDGVAGFKSNANGVALGMDGAYDTRTRLGLAFTYAVLKTDGSSVIAPHQADITLYQLVGYGSHQLGNVMELDYQIGFGQNKTDGKRGILLAGLTAAANYGSRLTTAGVGLTRSYAINDATAIFPSIRADYMRIRDAAYTETGADELNLIVNGRAVEQLVVAFDAKINHKLSNGANFTVNAGVGYDTMSKTSSVTAAFAGAPGASFTTTGIKTDPWIGRAGFGLTQKIGSGTDFSARIDTEYRKGFSNQTASVKVRWDF